MKINLSSTNLSSAHWLSPREHNLPIYSVADIRQLEADAFQAVDSWLMMQAAGLRSARKIIDLLQHNGQPNPHCVILAGPGNNGGDAYVVATELLNHGYSVDLIDYTVQNGNSAKGSADRQKAVQAWLATGQSILMEADLSFEKATIVVDGLFGIGCHSEPTGSAANLIRELNQNQALRRQAVRSNQFTVVSLDCPSGLNCDSGQANMQLAVHADITLTFIGLKIGLFMSEGKTLAGDVYLEQLGCENLELQQVVARVSADKSMARNIPSRMMHFHKGDFGSVSIVGGAQGMQGAALLSARSALRSGAGRVSITTPGLIGSPHQVDPIYPEIMFKTEPELTEFAQVLVIGPGLGQSTAAYELMCHLIAQADRKHLILDADALNLLAKYSHLLEQIKTLRSEVSYSHALILTPHPLEAARLLGTTVAEVQNNRIAAASKIAELVHGTVVLKGAGTVISDGYRHFINQTGSAALATAGSGDVLAGLLGALVGQSAIDPFELAKTAVWLHGVCVEPMYSHEEPIQLTHSSHLIDLISKHINHLLNQRTR